MRAVFVELPAFERCRSDYLDEAAFKQRKAFKALLKAELESRREK